MFFSSQTCLRTKVIMQKKGLDRNTIDKYYTSKPVVKQCIELVEDNIHIGEKDIVIEPSAGNGAFIKRIKKLCSNYKFYDIEPEHDEIKKQNFLEWDSKKYKKKYKNIHVIGNPPFGRQASLAIKFIKKCCEFAKTISFILPKSFKKESMKKHFTLNYHLISEFDLDVNAFLVNGEKCDVPCVFQIWEFKDEFRICADKETPSHFKFVKKENKPDISVRRVGVYAGNISKSIENKSIQSHYFIKFTNNKSIDKNIKKLEKIKFETDNTVGPKSISKPELIAEFNRLL